LRKRFGALLLLVSLVGCGSAASPTIVDVKVDLAYRPLDDSITVLRATVQDEQQTVSHDFLKGKDVPLVFPVTFGIELTGEVTGRLRIEVTASDKTGAVRASGVIQALTVVRGKVNNRLLWLNCESNCPADGGVDAAEADSRPDADQPEAGDLCGNGRLDNGEICDIAIPRGQTGACPPATCDDLLACTEDVHQGSGCNAVCIHREIVAFLPNDGCCPANATHLTDPDCSATCGDGTIQPGEFCDRGVPAGKPGACPVAADCPDSNPCTSDILLSANTCNAFCAHREILSFISGDGCCPTGATHSTDSDCPVVCGNGMVEKGETCDIGITPGLPGSCPAPCQVKGACIKEVTEGSGCTAVCRPVTITEFVAGDGCCPAGGNRALDPDCKAVCGNGVFEPGEVCDKAIAPGAQGACPTACAPDPSGCMPRSLQGSLADCTVHCVGTPITACSAAGDGCCPSGCSSANDPDCSSTCGNGIVELTETCDTAIPQGMRGSCPQSCDDGQACTTDMLLSKDTCNARCQNTPINMYIAGDGCCPTGGNHNLDSDCAPVCGNGVVESPKETCDPTILEGSTGACVTFCPAPSDCKQYALAGDKMSCTARCEATSIIQCMPGDGCCPAGCNHDSDSDCPAVCGNGIVDSDESCDKAITAGKPGACQSSCDDGDPCTTDSTSGRVEDCTRACSHAPVTACSAGDRCCPTGCTGMTDSDCVPVCGNSLVESKETCDPPSSCPTTCADDGDPCTKEQLVGAPEDCRAECQHVPITTCSGSTSDHCCPTPGCSSKSDSASFDTDCP
jgi:hypothetical protein